MMAGASTGATEGDDAPPDGRLDLWLVDLASAAMVLGEVAHQHGFTGFRPENADHRPEPRTVARAALRIVLAGYVGAPAAREPFLIATGGKPSFRRGGLYPPVEFSLAHCDTAAIIAVSRDGPVGVDIEAPRSIRITPRRRDMLLAEAAALAPAEALPDGPGEARFLQGWVRLEALAKATGEGLGALLGRLGRPEAPISETGIGGTLVRVRDVVVEHTSPLYAAVAGTGAALTGSTRPVAHPLPLDRTWLERWLSDS